MALALLNLTMLNVVKWKRCIRLSVALRSRMSEVGEHFSRRRRFGKFYLRFQLHR